MSNHKAWTWDHRGSKLLGPKLLPLGHHLDDFDEPFYFDYKSSLFLDEIMSFYFFVDGDHFFFILILRVIIFFDKTMSFYFDFDGNCFFFLWNCVILFYVEDICFLMRIFYFDYKNTRLSPWDFVIVFIIEIADSQWDYFVIHLLYIFL
jgi:hypothetical protein